MTNDLLNRCHVGDCHESMRMLIDAGVRVQTVVTSPPYYGLRDYGHDGQLGLEKTPAEYVATMVDVFRLVRELLADDGTLWLNIGDSYFSQTKGSGGSNPETSPKQAWKGSENGQQFRARRISAGDLPIKPKDLIGIPWMLAFALRADGWYLRSDIIWSKPNPMPESVTDRPTKAHEYVFLMSKSERYYYDAKAIQEPAIYAGSGRESKKRGEFSDKGQPDGREPFRAITETRNRRSVWSIPSEPYSGGHFAAFPRALVRPCVLAACRVGDVVFDPFLGSGTTAEVAQELGRQWVGCELNPEYVKLQAARTRQPGLVLA